MLLSAAFPFNVFEDPFLTLRHAQSMMAGELSAGSDWIHWKIQIDLRLSKLSNSLLSKVAPKKKGALKMNLKFY